jgi:PAS domain S-box-containing protein
VLIGREFTERNLAQAELERLHAELTQRHRDLEHERDFATAVVDSTPSLLCLATPGGYIVRFNTSLERLSGRRDDDLSRGNAFWDVFIAPEEREEVRRAVEEVVGEGGRGEFESTWITAAGERRDVTWSTTPLRDDRGDPRLLICGMDITERKLHEDELRRSRARLVEASDVERRRLERNLHDGAQQRLIALSLELQMYAGNLADDPTAQSQIEAARKEIAVSLDELRAVARGLHPAVVTGHGLGVALVSLAAGSPVPVKLNVAIEERLDESIEVAAYYVVSESLANIGKHAKATTVTIEVIRECDEVVVEVVDDGVGGADTERGSGLRGLADRVEALGGQLRVWTPSGGGTRVRAQMPCG